MRFGVRWNSSSQINLPPNILSRGRLVISYETDSASPVKRDAFFERVVEGTPCLNRLEMGRLELVVPSSGHIGVPQKHG